MKLIDDLLEQVDDHVSPYIHGPELAKKLMAVRKYCDYVIDTEPKTVIGEAKVDVAFEILRILNGDNIY